VQPNLDFFRLFLDKQHYSACIVIGDFRPCCESAADNVVYRETTGRNQGWVAQPLSCCVSGYKLAMDARTFR
jgi:hypothetical protein